MPHSSTTLPMRLRRAIIVEPASQGRWHWRLYNRDGSYGGSRSEEGGRAQVVAFAEQHSRACGLPALFRQNVAAEPRPMRRKGQF